MSGFRDDFSGAESTVGYDSASGSLLVRQIDAGEAITDAGEWAINDAMFSRAIDTLSFMTYFDRAAPLLPAIAEGSEIFDAHGVVTLSAPASTATAKGTAVLGVYYTDSGHNDIGWPRLYLTTLDGTELDVVAGEFSEFSLVRSAVEEFHACSASPFLADREPNYSVSADLPLYFRIDADNSVGAGDVTCSVTADEAGEVVLHSHTYHHAVPADGSPLLARAQFSADMIVYGQPPSVPRPHLSMFSWAYTVTPMTTVTGGAGLAGALAR